MKELVEEIAVKCYHCGNDCDDQVVMLDNKNFCCNGCLTVYEILENNNLCGYYDLNANSGVSLKAKNFNGRFDYLSEDSIVNELLAFKNDNIARVILHIPSIHCSSCVWLLENFNKLISGVITSRLNFVKKELSVSFNPTQVSLKNIVELLATLGYEPKLNLNSSNKTANIDHESRKLIKKIGLVGFCAGNIMMMSFPEYFGLDSNIKSDNTYQKFFLFLNLLLSLPVYFYGGADYLKGAFLSIKNYLNKTSDQLSVDISIALGLSALFFRSLYITLFLLDAKTRLYTNF